MTDYSQSSHFRELFEHALQDYENQTGTKLARHPLAEKIQSCNSVDSVLAILEQQAEAFTEFRGSNGRIMKSLKSTVLAIHALSSSTILSEVISMPFPPAQAMFSGVAVLLAAVKDVGASYDALVDLLESIERFLSRLDIYTKITPTAAMAEMVVKIMVELLSTLALATKQVKQKQPMKLVERLLGDNEGEAVLQRLGRLTQDEARTTAAQTLEVVYGLMQNMNVGGEKTHALPPSVAPAFVQPSEVMSSPPAFAPVPFPRVLGSSSPPVLAGESDEDLGSGSGESEAGDPSDEDLGSESGESEAGDPSDGPDGDDDGDFMPTRSSHSQIRSRRTSSVSSGSGAVRTPRSCRLSAPVPVPNLTKKSRGRRVPTAPVIVVQGGVQKNMRMYRCTIDGCYKCFARGEHLKRHVRSTHTNEKPHKCPVEGCAKDFSRHDNLGQHMRVHKGQAMTSMIGDP